MSLGLQVFRFLLHSFHQSMNQLLCLGHVLWQDLPFVFWIVDVQFLQSSKIRLLLNLEMCPSWICEQLLNRVDRMNAYFKSALGHWEMLHKLLVWKIPNLVNESRMRWFKEGSSQFNIGYFSDSDHHVWHGMCHDLWIVFDRHVKLDLLIEVTLGNCEVCERIVLVLDRIRRHSEVGSDKN